MASQQVQSVVIIGGGQAGAQAAQALRKRDYEGRVILIGDEAAAPYQRPPLSKAYLKGDMDEERLYFKPREYYGDARIELRAEVSATAIDREARHVRLSDGETVSYDRLLLATGARPRPLPVPGADLDGVLELRGLQDANRLKARLTTAGHITIIGGGYIGLEAAASARALGKDVVVLERMERCLERVTSPVISEFYHRLHASHGVDVRCGAAVTAMTQDGAKLIVHLDGASPIPTDLVLSGIGVIPNQELAQDAGLACSRGIEVDLCGRTSDPAIFAAGDCTCRPLTDRDGLHRLESVHNALEQGDQAAAAMLGQDAPALDVPWFWSDQYDIKLQTAGVSTGYTDIVLRGDRAAAPFSAFYYREQALLAVDALNDPASFLATKQMLKRGISPDPQDVSDTAVPLKSLLAQTQ